jgi:dihydroflavonol-4-reductase
MSPSDQWVLVTGGTGFVGSHCILKLLGAGYNVRTTVRSLTREADVRAMLKEGGVEPGARLRVVAADLERDEGWAEAAAECAYVLHVASPMPPAKPKHEDDLIVPAREGALRVLRAARGAGVKRVVLTSSSAAIAYGHKPRRTPFDETDWTDVSSPDVPAYQKSKAVAERAAWDFIASQGGGLQLSVVNPVAILGPVLGADYSPSIQLIQRLMDGAVPGCPRLIFGYVDVRDLADLHLRAMTQPAADGQRFLAVSGEPLSMLAIARILRRRLGAKAARVPRWQLPDGLVRLAALRDPGLKLLAPQLGVVRRTTAAKAQRLLGWSPRPMEDSIVDTAESLGRLGLLKG